MFQITSLQRLLGALCVACLWLSSPSFAASQGLSVSILGPRQVTVGGVLQLSAVGVPAGGTYFWSLESQGLNGPGGPGDPVAQLSANGGSASIRGLRLSSALGDIGVRVFYQVGAQVFRGRAKLTCVAGDLRAYRPQHGAGYGVFPRTAIAEADEESAVAGPGIRINGSGDLDPNGEDDLIEIRTTLTPAGASYRLRRSASNLSLWTTRDKQAGTQVAFGGNQSAVLSGSMTLWTEWSGTAQGTTDLRIVAAGAGVVTDLLRFTTFRTIVMALGGETQVPSKPVDPSHGTFVVGLALYRAGYDVHMHDEDRVAPNGSGPVYNEVVTAIRKRAADQVVSFGYSHGGGSTYDLVERLDTNSASIGNFSVPYTSYVDAVENDSDTDVSMELRRPIGSAYHANHYQLGSFFDFFLDGGPVPSSNPGTTGLDVETQSFGIGATHFSVDDFVQVTNFIQSNLLQLVQR